MTGTFGTAFSQEPNFTASIDTLLLVQRKHTVVNKNDVLTKSSEPRRACGGCEHASGWHFVSHLFFCAPGGPHILLHTCHAKAPPGRAAIQERDARRQDAGFGAVGCGADKPGEGKGEGQAPLRPASHVECNGFRNRWNFVSVRPQHARAIDRGEGSNLGDHRGILMCHLRGGLMDCDIASTTESQSSDPMLGLRSHGSEAPQQLCSTCETSV